MPKSKKNEELEQRIDDLTNDLQRTRADFENYRKRAEQEKSQARDHAAATTILRLLPVIDNLERALGHLPEDLKDNAWANGVVGLSKNLQKSLQNLQVTRIEAAPRTEFNPDLHEAIQMDEEGEGDKEIIAEELQAGYKHNGTVIRHSMVKVTRG